jgi:hypothetical protein
MTNLAWMITIMNHLPFNQPGQFWRGNLHTHSTLSDGALTPEQVCTKYREAGYDFISLTDHFMEKYNYPVVDTSSFRREGFTTIFGAELHTGYTQVKSIWHILANGLPLDFAPPAAGESGPQIAQRALAAGAFVSIAHPSWYALTEADALSLGAVHAVEVSNGTCSGIERADSWPFLDVLLNRGYRYFACATDDCHYKDADVADFAHGWVHVKAESLTPEALLKALKAGHFYASTGPQLHDIQVVPGEKITVACSPATKILVLGHQSLARRTKRAGNGSGLIAQQTNDQGLITRAEFSLEGFDSPFCRVTVIDQDGKNAWSNPIWF